MLKKIAVSTTTFAQDERKPLEILEVKNFEIVRNTLGRSLTNEETIKLLQGCVGVVAGTELYDAAILQQLKNLKVISRVGTGTDSIDLAYCKENSIQVLNTPNASISAVAELTLGLILNLLRHISWMDQNTHRGHWKKKMGSLLTEKNVGIIGLGRIGQEVANLCEAFGANILFFDPFVKANQFPKFQALDLNAILKEADIVTLHLPMTESSRSLIGEKEFALMKKSVILINCSRGGMVDEEALYQALKSQKIQGAALDVFDREPYQGPLQELDNVILTPHIGSYAKEARIKMEIEAVNNLIKGLSLV